MDRISEFRGEYYFLSNMFICNNDIITKDNKKCKTSENLYQASKSVECMITGNTLDSLLDINPYDSKKDSKSILLRSDWDYCKDQVMYDAVYRKFYYNPDLKSKLIDTYPLYLEEGDKGKSDYWGTIGGVGYNRLGTILMSVRARFMNPNNLFGLPAVGDSFKFKGILEYATYSNKVSNKVIEYIVSSIDNNIIKFVLPSEGYPGIVECSISNFLTNLDMLNYKTDKNLVWSNFYQDIYNDSRK